MALFHCYHYSETLRKRSSFDVIMPDNLTDKSVPCVYLLHGLSDDQSMWQRFTRIEALATARGMAVVMPNADRSFYTDMKYGSPYYTYIADEIVNYTRKAFNLSTEREKTFICGNSMGGYGAYKIAMRNPEVFGAAVSFSGVLVMAQHVKNSNFDGLPHLIWGDNFKDAVENTDDDLFKLALDLDRFATAAPRLLQICGTSDFLYDENLKFKEFAEKLSLDYRYLEGAGGHCWDFWNEWLPVALDFFTEKL